MKHHINVMFTAACGWPTHATVNALRLSDVATYTVIGVDCKPYPAALNYCDYLYQVPRCSDDNYIDEIMALCEKHNVDVVVPLISEDIPPFFNALDRFDTAGIKVLMSGQDSMVMTANDKFKLGKFLEEHGIDAMPKTKELNPDTLMADLKEFGYPDKPVVAKLKDGCGAIGFKIIDENKAKGANGISSRESRANPYIAPEQVAALYDTAPNRYLLQEYLPGRELGTLCLVDNGRTVYALSHDNYEMAYAVTTYCELVDDPDAKRITTLLNGLLHLDGNIGYDFKRDADGKLRLLEINPRISATVSLAVKAGVNIVEMGILHKLGYDIEENITPLFGMRLQRVYGTLYTYKGEPYGT